MARRLLARAFALPLPRVPLADFAAATALPGFDVVAASFFAGRGAAELERFVERAIS